MGGFSSKKPDPKADIWDTRKRRVQGDKENREEWAENTTTSYNLLDLQQGYRTSPDPSPFHIVRRSTDPDLVPNQSTSFKQSRDDTGYKDDTACPRNYVPNKVRPTAEKNYYTSPRRARKKPRSNPKPRPPWNSDLPASTPSQRKLSTESDVSTVHLNPTNRDGRISPPAFTTVSKSPVPANKFNSSPRASVSRSPRKMPGQDSGQPRKQERHEPYQTKSPRKSVSDPSMKKYSGELSRNRSDAQQHPRATSLDRRHSHRNGNHYSSENAGKHSTLPAAAAAKPRPAFRETRDRNRRDSREDAQTYRTNRNSTENSRDQRKETWNSVEKREPVPRDPSSRRSRDRVVDQTKPRDSRAAGASRPTRDRQTNNIRQSADRNKLTDKVEFTNISTIKSATASLASTTSNFGSRTKVISFNDKKCTLGSTGMAQITRLENQFKVRQFPSGSEEGLRRTLGLLQSGDWEKEVEGLELLTSLAQQHPQVVISEEGKVRNLLLKQVKNLRSQVCRAACQCCAMVFLSLGRSMETDLEKMVKELLQKAADTNKFIRTDAATALDVMAENVSVNKAVITLFSLGRDHKNAVVRSTMARIVDSIVARLGAERLMGSSEELQEIIFKEGSALLTDGSLEVRQHGKHMWTELVQHSNTNKLLQKHVSPVQLRNISKVLDSLQSH